MAKKLGTTTGTAQSVSLKTTKAKAALPLLPPSPPFYLVGNPRCWQVNCAGNDIVPAFRQFALVRGVNHIDEHGDDSLFFAKMRTNGDIPLMDTGPYLQRVPVKNGFAHITMFETAQPMSTRTIRDDKAYDEFCASHKDTIGKPPIDVLRAGLSRALRDLDKASTMSGLMAKRRVLRLEKEVLAWEASLETAMNPEQTTVKTKEQP